MEERTVVLVFTVLAAVVGLLSAAVPRAAAYALGVLVLLAASKALKRKTPEFKQYAPGAIFLYLFMWIVVWTLAVNP